MGLFDKKNCDICGEKIGILGNRKLDNGNLCKKCAGKLSPWFEERRHSTVDDIKEQLDYREENKNAVRNFKITREFSGKILAYKYRTGFFLLTSRIVGILLYLIRLS